MSYDTEAPPPLAGKLGWCVCDKWCRPVPPAWELAVFELENIMQCIVSAQL